jgi:hypothetical protein
MRKLLVLLVVCASCGCGAAKGKVSGRVLYQGQPLPGGLLTFQPVNPQFNAVAVSVDEEGNYVAELPVGDVRIAIDNRHLQSSAQGPRGVPDDLPEQARQALASAKQQASPPPPAGNPAARAKLKGRYVPIPDKFYTIESSGLKLHVEQGEQKHDIDLTPGS